MFALHLYLQKQVCSEENYLSVHLCIHQSMSVKYFCHTAEHGNRKIRSLIFFLDIEINAKNREKNGQFLEHRII